MAKIECAVLPVTLFQANCVIVWDEESADALVVDPGGDVEDILRVVEEGALKVHAIVLTHGHLDHMNGAQELKLRLDNIPILLHQADHEMVQQLSWQQRMLGFPVTKPPVLGPALQEHKVHRFGTLSFQVHHTPGHSPGSCCIVFPTTPKLMLSGDTLFAGAVGRTDLPGGNTEQLVRSLESLMDFEDDTRVIPGHGPETTIGIERETNPVFNDDSF